MPSVPLEAARTLQNKLVIDLARVPSLAAVGGSAKWSSSEADNKKVYIVRSGEAHFDAFLNHCTHLGRELEYRHDEKRLRCVSYGHSEFDMEGHVLGGPATGSLTKLRVEETNGSLEIAI
jgi:Rieske Fe-S protein